MQAKNAAFMAVIVTKATFHFNTLSSSNAKPVVAGLISLILLRIAIVRACSRNDMVAGKLRRFTQL